MTVTIRPGDPRAPQASALLATSHRLMQDLFPSESNHFLSIEALYGPDIRFLVALEGEHLLGCGALALEPDYGEVKSMFVAPEARGAGVATALMRALIEIGRGEGLSCLRLETGDTLYASHKLYQKHGFVLRGPFGDYGDDPMSLFMEKAL